MLSVEQIQFCAEEVHRQGRDALAVADMCAAWQDALDVAESTNLSLAHVIRWGHLVEPEALNAPNGWRTVGVTVGYTIKCHPSEVDSRMERWFWNVSDMTPEEAYKEFEEVHPFADGNGRVGKIIFNYLRGTLFHPVMPPNFWGIANP